MQKRCFSSTQSAIHCKMLVDSHNHSDTETPFSHDFEHDLHSSSPKLQSIKQKDTIVVRNRLYLNVLQFCLAWYQFAELVLPLSSPFIVVKLLISSCLNNCEFMQHTKSLLLSFADFIFFLFHQHYYPWHFFPCRNKIDSHTHMQDSLTW